MSAHGGVRQAVAKTVKNSTAVIVIHGASGFGKKHLVRSVIKEHNNKAKSLRDRRVLHIFTPASISTKETKKRFKQLLSNKDVTGQVPVLMLTQFHGLASDMQKEIIDKLLAPAKCSNPVQRSLATRRNPVIILTDGTQEKYDARVARLLSPLQSIVMDVPSFRSKKDAVNAFALQHELDVENVVDKIAGSCLNFHVLKTKLYEYLHRGHVMVHESDKTISRDKFFEDLRSLRVPTKACHNLAQTEEILQKLGESCDFALKTLQLNPPTYEDHWKYSKTSNGCDKRELVKTAADQLAQQKDAYSELDTLPLWLQEQMQGVTVRSVISNCNIVNEYHKLEFPSYTNNLGIVSAVDALKNEYSYETNMLCSTMSALERYGIMKTAYSNQNDMFTPLQRVINHDLDMTEALNAKIRSTLFVWDKETDEDQSINRKPTKTHVRKRKHQLQITDMFETKTTTVSSASPFEAPSSSPSEAPSSSPSKALCYMPKRTREL